MNLRPFVLVLAAAMLAAVLWWVLGAPGDTPVPSDPTTPSSASEQQPATVDPGATAAGPAVSPEADESEPRDRDEVATGHRIQVLGVDGSPLPNVPVCWSRESDNPEAFERWIESLESASAMSLWNIDALPRSDAKGLLTIPTLDRCLVWTTIEGAAGHVVCEARPEQGESPLHTLQLVPSAMVEVIVLDGEGVPVPGRLDFTVHFGDVDKLAGLPPDMSPQAYGSPWAQDTGAILVGMSGRRFLSGQPDSRTLERMGGRPSSMRTRICLHHLGTTFGPQFLEDGDPGPVVFQLPATGTLILRLQGFPAEIQPMIRLAGPDRSARAERGVQLEGADLPSWRFEDVAVDEPLEVVFFGRFQTSDRDYLGGVSIPPMGIEGPDSAGATVERTVDFSWPPGFRGRVIFPESVRVERGKLLSDANRGCLDAEFFLREGAKAPGDWIRCGLLPDGSFILPLEPEDRWVHQHAAEIERVEMVFLEDRPREAEPDWVPVRLWAFVDVRHSSLSESVDLGEVFLQSADPLLIVDVRDSDGMPIEGASVEVEVGLSSASGARFGGQSIRDQATDARGEAWFIGPFWSPNSRSASPADVRSLRVTASHSSGVSVTQEFPAASRRVRLEMSAAGSFAGSILPRPQEAHVVVALVPSGTPSEEVNQARIAAVSLGTHRGSEPIPFAEGGVPAGVYDLVVTEWGGERRELHRVGGLEIRANQELRDPRIQQIDLSGVLGELRMLLYDSAGSRLRAAQFRDDPVKLNRYSEGGGASGGRATWLGDEIVVILPAELTSHIGIAVPGFEEIRIDDAVPGQRELSLTALPKGAVRLPAMPASAGALEFEAQGMWLKSSFPLKLFEVGLTDEPQEVKVFWPAAGQVSLTWTVRDEHSGWRKAAGSRIELTQERIDSGETIELTIPQELLDAIPR